MIGVSFRDNDKSKLTKIYIIMKNVSVSQHLLVFYSDSEFYFYFHLYFSMTCLKIGISETEANSNIQARNLMVSEPKRL